MSLKQTSIIMVLAFVSPVFGMVYEHEEYGLRITFPGHWDTRDIKDLSTEFQQRMERMYSFDTLALSRIVSDDNTDRASILVQFNKFEQATYQQARSRMRSQLSKEAIVTEARRYAESNTGRDYRRGTYETESNFVSASNRAYGIFRPDTSTIAMIVKILVPEGVVNLKCFAAGAEAEGFVERVHKIADSFEYIGAATILGQYADAPPEVLAKDALGFAWEWLGIILVVLIVLGFAKMVLFR